MCDSAVGDDGTDRALGGLDLYLGGAANELAWKVLFIAGVFWLVEEELRSASGKLFGSNREFGDSGFWLEVMTGLG